MGRLGVVFGVVLGSKIDPKSFLELNPNRLGATFFRSCDRLVPRWLQDRSKSAPGGVLGRLGRGFGPLLGAFGPSLDGLGRVLDRLEGSLEVVLSSFWSSLIRFIVSTS